MLTNINISHDQRQSSNRRAILMLKELFFQAHSKNGKSDESIMQAWKSIKMHDYQLIVHEEIKNSSVPEIKFNGNHSYPNVRLEEADLFLATSTALGFALAQESEEVALQEVVYFNSQSRFTHQEGEAPVQHKAIESLYKCEFAIDNNGKQLVIPGTEFKQVSSHEIGGQYHYPNGYWYNMPKPVLLKGSQQIKLKPETPPTVDLDSLKGDTGNGERTFMVASMYGIVIVDGREKMQEVFNLLEGNCLG